MIVLNILCASVQSAVSVIWDREFAFLREMLILPMPRCLILLGKTPGGATVAIMRGSLALATISAGASWTTEAMAIGRRIDNLYLRLGCAVPT